jgi:hypothetical protein
MNKAFPAGVAATLLWAGLALGQVQQLPPVAAPAPAAEAPGCAASPEGQQPCPAFMEGHGTIHSAWSFDAEYLLWWFGNPHDERAIGTAGLGGATLGSLGDADHFRRQPDSGGRFSVGYWQIMDNPWVRCGIRDWGVEADLFFMAHRSLEFSDGTSPNIVRPFFDLNNRVDSGFIVAAPGLATGGISARAQSNLWGGEINFIKNVYFDYPGTSCSASVLAGFRYLSLDDQLNINSISVFNSNLAAFPAFAPFAGNTLQVADSFSARNHFYGGQIGVSARYWPIEKVSMEVAIKLALGMTSEELEIGGSQLRTLPDGTRTASSGGLLALPSNIGDHTISRFTQVPEVDFKFRCPLNCHCAFTTGVECFYWSRVIRPGEQIDRQLDITQIPNFPGAAAATPTGLNQPGVSFHQSHLVGIGFNFGVEFVW